MINGNSSIWVSCSGIEVMNHVDGSVGVCEIYVWGLFAFMF